MTTTTTTSPIASAAGIRILVVDDSAIDRKLAGSFLEKVAGWKPLFANDGIEALNTLGRERLDLVVTDLQMPEMNGLQLVSEIRAKYPALPVILMTAYGSEEIALAALQRGAASYVPKRKLSTDLVSTIQSVLDAARTDRDQRRLLDALTCTESQFRLSNDVSLISPLIGHFQINIARMGLCDETGLIRVSVALREAIVNAIEHGNLELSSALREGAGREFQDMAARRGAEPPYCDRHVYIAERISRDEAHYAIRDEGPGFNPFALPDPTAPENLEKLSGRGLLLIRTFMDDVSYNETGNQITLVKRRDATVAAE